MKTKEEILHQLGYTINGTYEKKLSFDLIISQAMDEWSKQQIELISPEQLLALIDKVFGPGCASICKERKRQIEVEGWTAENDDEYKKEEFSYASASYILPDKSRFVTAKSMGFKSIVPDFWPWLVRWWKPTPDNRTRELSKGGALAAAEIDRLKIKDHNVL